MINWKKPWTERERHGKKYVKRNLSYKGRLDYCQYFQHSYWYVIEDIGIYQRFYTEEKLYFETNLVKPYMSVGIPFKPTLFKTHAPRRVLRNTCKKI